MQAALAGLLLTTPAVEVALDPAAVVGQRILAYAGKSLLPQHQQLAAEANLSSASLPIKAEEKVAQSKNDSAIHSAQYMCREFGKQCDEAKKEGNHSAQYMCREFGSHCSQAKKEKDEAMALSDKKVSADEDPQQQQQQQQQQGQQQQGQQEEEETGESKVISIVVSVMLMASLTFTMTLFYLVNNSDEDIRQHSWRAISQTIVIFCSVLIFNASNAFVTWFHAPSLAHSQQGQQQQGHQQQAEPKGFGYFIDKHAQRLYASFAMHEEEEHTYGTFGIAMIQFTVWLLIFQASVAICTGVLWWKEEEEEEPAEEEKGKAPEPTRKEVAAKASAMIVGHVAGFAAINAFGQLLQLEPFHSNIWLALLIWVLVIPGVFAFVLASEKLRDYCVSKVQGVSHETLHLLEHNCEHGGNDIVALCVSFLLVQVFRCSLSGHMPDAEGGESEREVKSHGALQTTALISFGFVAGLLCVAGYFTARKIKSKMAKRGLVTFQITMAMTKGWGFYFGGVWLLALFNMESLIGIEGMTADSALIKVIEALVLSAYAILLIFVLDKLADADFTDDDADAAIYTFMGGLGILIGFAWEQAFEKSLGTVVQAEEEQQPALPEPVLKGLMAFLIVLLVLPAWRIWILRNTLKAEMEGFQLTDGH